MAIAAMWTDGFGYPSFSTVAPPEGYQYRWLDQRLTYTPINRTITTSDIFNLLSHESLAVQ